MAFAEITFLQGQVAQFRNSLRKKAKSAILQEWGPSKIHQCIIIFSSQTGDCGVPNFGKTPFTCHLRCGLVRVTSMRYTEE